MKIRFLNDHANRVNHGLPIYRKTFGIWILLAGLLLCAHAQAEGPAYAGDCGPLENGYGPYDYTNPQHRRDRLPLVEGAHLTNDVISLRRGNTAINPLGDIDYTLRASPNHHVALDAMARLHRKNNKDKLPGGRYSIDCWFERAMRFNPADGIVHMLYGIHLFKLEQYERAELSLLKAAELLPNSAEAKYNLGLLYARLGQYDLARDYAHSAYGMGYPLPGLRNQLIRADEWSNE